ncbi:MAG: SCO family protein, partial [Pseudonocardiaceae bacterium]
PGPRCCGGDAAREPARDDGRRASTLPLPRGIEVEDQQGERLLLADFVARGPTVLAFFYTRCANPRKCSLSITSLAGLCRELAAAHRLNSVQVAAITYDPGYDLPARLLRYGRDRGLPFGPTVRMFRAVAGYDLLREHLALRVGYTASVVNRHSIELFFVDSTGCVARTWSRRRWVPADVLAHIEHPDGQ